MSKYYVGAKLIKAVPMTRLDYNNLRGWEVPSDERPDDEGYLVEYTEKDNTPNVEGYKGYVSWSPKNVFEQSYREVDL